MANQSLITRSDFYVYCLVRGDTGVPFYIGKGSGDRWDHHERWARKGRHGQKYAIIRKMHAHGHDIIKVKIHDGLTETVALTYERALTEAIGTGKRGPLVNLRESAGRPRGMRHTPESIAKMSAVKIGKKHSPESRANMKAAVARRGVKPSPECVLAATAAKLGKKHSPERTERHAAKLRGRKHTDEHRAKNGAANRGKKRSPEQCANIGAARRGKKLSPQHIASLSAVRRGKKWSPEAIAKGKATRAANKLARGITQEHPSPTISSALSPLLVENTFQHSLDLRAP